MADDIMVTVARPKAPDAVVEILTPADAERLLSVCDDEILPGVVLGLFCGLRQAEIEKIQWDAVNLPEGTVTVSSAIAKTRSRRVCTIPPNAVGWLTPFSACSGRVWTTAARNRWNLARIAAGFGPFFSTAKAVRKAAEKADQKGKKLRPWPANALRHTAISARVAIERNLAAISYESGNSPSVIQEHYNGLMSEKSAKALFAILPSVPANVVNIRKAS